MSELGVCEVCGDGAANVFGIDNTPLCTNHLIQADRRYQGTVKYTHKKLKDRAERGKIGGSGDER